VNLLLTLKGANGVLVPGVLSNSNQSRDLQDLGSGGTKAILGTSSTFEALFKEYRRGHVRARVNSSTIAW
jgi:hypothetical protein